MDYDLEYWIPNNMMVKYKECNMSTALNCLVIACLLVVESPRAVLLSFTMLRPFNAVPHVW